MEKLVVILQLEILLGDPLSAKLWINWIMDGEKLVFDFKLIAYFIDVTNFCTHRARLLW